MSKEYGLSLFIFRRDLRIHDNTALNAALERSDRVAACFIFSPTQIKEHAYFSENAFRFMLDSLTELEGELKERSARLHFFEGEHTEICSRLINELKPDAIFFNRDYTPYARSRDKEIYETAKKSGVRVHQYADSLLLEPEDSLKDDKSPYTVFTPFFKKNSSRKVPDPAACKSGSFYTGNIKGAEAGLLDKQRSRFPGNQSVRGGRSHALRILSSLSVFRDYDKKRDFPALDATSHLSAHNKFGTVSIREVYHKLSRELGSGHSLIRQLYWRDFFTHIGFHFPHVFGRAFHKKYSDIDWENDKKLFNAWCEGRTGFPIVDAGMRQLNQTGFMHNRLRMVTASFLTKDLHIDWRWGEKYFASKLVDYDPAVNNGSWQWAASTGCDAQPYFRIFNPWLQQKRFDPEAEFIKIWVPELRHVPAKALHNLYKSDTKTAAYPLPCVDHSKRSQAAKLLYEA